MVRGMLGTMRISKVFLKKTIGVLDRYKKANYFHAHGNNDPYIDPCTLRELSEKIGLTTTKIKFTYT